MVALQAGSRMSAEGNGKPRVEDNIALAVEITKRKVTHLLRKKESLYDTYEYSDALVGLMKACETFDPNRRTKDGEPITFGTYAWRCITREIAVGRRIRTRQNRLTPMLLGEMQNKDRQGVFEIEDNSKPPLPLHLLDQFFKEDSEDSRSQRRCKQILYDYYIEDMTYEQLGAKHGVTRERIRQLLNRGLMLVQKRFAAEIEAAKDD